MIAFLLELLPDVPSYVEIEIMNSTNENSRVQMVKIQYEFLTKYCKWCMLQGYNECHVPSQGPRHDTMMGTGRIPNKPLKHT